MKKTSSLPVPDINVTPLIDVLLVLLIIFMVTSPLKPASFAAKLPSQLQHDRPLPSDSHTLVVTIEPDRTLKLNSVTDMGTVNDMSKLTSELVSVFAQRTANRAYRVDMYDRVDLPEAMRIEKTVFIKAPRSMPYGEVMRVMDGLKGTGADPIGLQLDDLK